MPRLKVITSQDEPDDAIEPRAEELRLLEAMLFASAEPVDEKDLAARLPQGVDVRPALSRLQEDYATRGVNLVRIGGKWTFRTAGDLSWLLSKETVETRKLSRAAIETLAIIAYHQPVTRTEIEEIRGVTTSKGSVDRSRRSPALQADDRVAERGVGRLARHRWARSELTGWPVSSGRSRSTCCCRPDGSGRAGGERRPAAR